MGHLGQKRRNIRYVVRKTKHKLLFIKASINRNIFSRVFVNEGTIINVMSPTTLKKLGKNMEDLVPTDMKMSSFMDVALNVLWMLITDVLVGIKVLIYAFFVID